MIHTCQICPTCGSQVSLDALPDQEDVSEVMARLRLARVPALLFLQLWNAQGRTVTYEAFLDLQNALTGDDGGHAAAVRSTKKCLWRELRKYPVEIASVYAIGYRLVKKDPDWDWRNEIYK